MFGVPGSHRIEQTKYLSALRCGLLNRRLFQIVQREKQRSTNQRAPYQQRQQAIAA